MLMGNLILENGYKSTNGKTQFRWEISEARDKAFLKMSLLWRMMKLLFGAVKINREQEKTSFSGVTSGCRRWLFIRKLKVYLNHSA